ncbi:MAG TPA: 4a-hydroxytetrahydrobiopterin dehydratase [Aestuariivirgaceae bacterium]|nr:4a-hydroxytetrahydrobiopterin dehydratase [Aestuariivirgaceae bacterium]
MTERSTERTYGDAEVQQRLAAELPQWQLDAGCISRRYNTTSWKSTLMVVNAVGHLAEVAWHHPDITASYSSVEVRLRNHAAGGITDKDFELARKIEDVVDWQPANEPSALTGPPEKLAVIKR